MNMSAVKINDSVIIRNARLAVKIELEKKRMCKQPISKFDLKTKEVYLEYPDSSKVVVGKAMQQGRYSQWCK